MRAARFARLVDEDPVVYYATYTAFNGVSIAQHLLETVDFRNFGASPIAGTAATGNGLAILPRKTRSTDSISRCRVRIERRIRLRFPTTRIAGTQSPRFSNDRNRGTYCNSAIAVPRSKPLMVGSLLVHGVGPMRTYALGALLLDLEDPRRLIRRRCCAGLTTTPGVGDCVSE